MGLDVGNLHILWLPKGKLCPLTSVELSRTSWECLCLYETWLHHTCYIHHPKEFENSQCPDLVIPIHDAFCEKH